MGGQSAAYDEDLVLWAEAQAEGLRGAASSGSNLALDWLNLAEEVESLARSDRRELKKRLGTIIEHLLKLQLSPAIDPRAGWEARVRRQRGHIQFILEDSPSLRRELDEALATAWRLHAPLAFDELLSRGEAPADAAPDPAAPAYTVEQVLDNWLPD